MRVCRTRVAVCRTQLEGVSRECVPTCVFIGHTGHTARPVTPRTIAPDTRCEEEVTGFGE